MVVITKPGKDRRGYNKEDESDFDSNPKRKRSKTYYSSNLDEKPDGSRIMLSRLEKVMFGDRIVDRDPIVRRKLSSIGLC